MATNQRQRGQATATINWGAGGPRGRGAGGAGHEVARYPYFVPTDAGGKGSWRMVPADRAHRSRVITQDGQAEFEMGVYEEKGWVPIRQATPAQRRTIDPFMAASCMRRGYRQYLPDEVVQRLQQAVNDPDVKLSMEDCQPRTARIPTGPGITAIAK